MRLLIILLVLSFTPTLSFGQQEQAKRRKMMDGTYEFFSVIKVEKSILRQGDYKRTKDKYGEIVIQTGSYDLNRKTGKWEYYLDDEVYKEEYYTADQLDSVKKYRSNHECETQIYKNGLLVKTSSVKLLGGGISQRVVGDSSFISHQKYPNYRALYINGKQEGNWTLISESGFKTDLNYSEGKPIGEATVYHKNGAVFHRIFRDESSQRQGLHLFFNASGDTIAQFNYVNDKLHGACWTRYSFPNYFCKATFDMGKLMEYQEYNPDGSKSDHPAVIDGNGQLLITGHQEDELKKRHLFTFENGVMHGPQITYLYDEPITSTYNNGKPSGNKKPFDSTSYSLDYFSRSWLKTKDTLDLGLQVAKFTLGENAMNRYIGDKLVIPDIAYEMAQSGTIYVRFVVGPFGGLTKIRSVNQKKLGFGLEQACIDIIKGTEGLWSPGLQFGTPSSVQFAIPIRFEFE